MTKDTEVPEMPKKVLQLPDEAAYHKSQVELEEKIDDNIK